MIVFDDADIDAVVEGSETFGFYNAARIVLLPAGFRHVKGRV
ncbi:hypothetical protein ACNKHO_11060 [Shigella flexneri]